MAVRKTSRDAYNNEVQGFKYTLYNKILDCLAELDKTEKGMTRGEIAYYTKMEKSTTSARVNEMIKNGMLIELPERRKDYLTNITSYVVIKNPQQRML
jgi:DNA-binding MarR family transcriptional regulator